MGSAVSMAEFVATSLRCNFESSCFGSTCLFVYGFSPVVRDTIKAGLEKARLQFKERVCVLDERSDRNCRGVMAASNVCHFFVATTCKPLNCFKTQNRVHYYGSSHSGGITNVDTPDLRHCRSMSVVNKELCWLGRKTIDRSSVEVAPDTSDAAKARVGRARGFLLLRLWGLPAKVFDELNRSFSIKDIVVWMGGDAAVNISALMREDFPINVVSFANSTTPVHHSLAVIDDFLVGHSVNPRSKHYNTKQKKDIELDFATVFMEPASLPDGEYADVEDSDQENQVSEAEP